MYVSLQYWSDRFMKRILILLIILTFLLPPVGMEGVSAATTDQSETAPTAASEPTTAPEPTEPEEPITAPPATSIKDYTIARTYFTISWKQVDVADGYQLQYCKDRFFLNPKTITINDSSVTSRKVLVSNFLPCYLRIRAFRLNENGKALYSNWKVTGNTTVSKEAIIIRVAKPNGKEFELRSAAGQKMKKYDTLQGGTAYGNIGWYTLYDRKVNKCKVVKVNLKTMKVTKVSAVLNVEHGSSIAYDPYAKNLAIAHGPYHYKRVTLLDPNKLTVKKTITLTLPSKTKGCTSKRSRAFKGITALTYNREHHFYVARLKELGDLVYYDSNFKPLEYIYLKVKGGGMYQGIDSVGNYVLVGQSPYKKNKYNRITVYNWRGQYLSTVRLCKRYEVETLYHTGKTLYAGYYRSYYETYYLSKWRIKVYRGKKHKIKKRLKYTRLKRDNYIFRVTDL